MHITTVSNCQSGQYLSQELRCSKITNPLLLIFWVLSFVNSPASCKFICNIQTVQWQETHAFVKTTSTSDDRGHWALSFGVNCDLKCHVGYDATGERRARHSARAGLQGTMGARTAAILEPIREAASGNSMTLETVSNQGYQRELHGAQTECLKFPLTLNDIIAGRDQSWLRIKALP